MPDTNAQFTTPTGLYVSGGGITFDVSLNAPNVVNSFNGVTGAVGCVTTSAANTFTALQTFSSGISASGATVNGNIGLQNSEYIRNTTDGRVDFMPAPAGSTAFGLYCDLTSWSYGVIIGTIRSSDGAKNTGGNIRWDVPMVVMDDTDLGMGSSQAYKFYMSTTGNDTLQIVTRPSDASYSGAVALVDGTGRANANRSPGTTHSNPNLYIYSSGAASANDFIRFDHDRTNGNIVSGGTSGIFLQSGSGVFGVSGGVSASGGSTFASNVSFNSTTSHTGLATFSGGVSGAGGITLSGTIAFNGQTFTNVVDSINGYTGAVGSLPPRFGTTGDATIRVITYPDGVTTQRADRSQYFWTFSRTYQSGGSMAVYANRTYFQPQSVSKSTTIKSLRFMAANTGITGNCYFSIWSADPNNGNPSSRLYASASTVVGSGYNYTTVTNASGLVTVPAGNWWLAVSFSSTPTIYSQHKDYIIPYAGGTDFNSGYKNYYPVVDTNGFTAPTAISGSGITYAWVEYHPSTYISPHFEWQTI